MHPFLAITHKVDADILVIESWIPQAMLDAAADEFRSGNYRLILISGLSSNPEDGSPAPSDIERARFRLEQLSIPRENIVPCPAPFVRWMRTSKTAKAVQQKVAQQQLRPKGINVVTAGPHARETWVAYEHIFGSSVRVGIISIPKTSYPADRWWTTREGLLWVSKDFVAWLKEVLVGDRASAPVL